jgi:glyoxylase-like metal-dependent hydrolase (beta-lactamase superfamily II)
MATELAPGLWWIALPVPSYMQTVNLYLVRDHDGYAMIDSGLASAEAWESFEQQLDELAVPHDALHTIVVTHGHHDHFGLADRLRERSGAEVWLHQDDAEFLQRYYVEIDFYRDQLRDWLIRHGAHPDEAFELTARLENSVHPELPGPPDRSLQGGELLAVGPYRFEIIWSPGHTPGHVCLYEPQRRWFFSGDHILPHVSPNVSLRPYSPESPMPGYLDSLRRISEMEIDLGLPGHGDPFPTMAGRARDLLSHQLDRQAMLTEIVAPVPQTAYELAARVWADTKPYNWTEFRGYVRRNAVGTLVAHLDVLANQGRIRRHDDSVVRWSRLEAR